MYKIKFNIWGYFVSTFVFLIVFGAFLLKIPSAYKITEFGNLSFIDALFTSTSAVCVTGLTVKNTSNFTYFGQLLILFLIQVGGLGIMTITTSIVLFVKGEINLNQRLMVTKITDLFGMNEVESILKYIILLTFIIETLGALFLTLGFLLQGEDIHSAIYLGIFHSISAFCNAGFSTFDNSLLNSNNLIKIVVSLLVILGGLGYYVIYDIYRNINFKRRFKTHTKIVLITSSLLIIFGAFIFLFIAKDMDIMDSFFQSISARTAGFNSIDLLPLDNLSKLTLLILMIIGASPGGTGGGIKTSTFFVATLSVVEILKGNNKIVFLGREISSNTILRSFCIISLYIFVDILASLVMTFFYQYNFIEILFETTSALGTVGLSLGVSGKVDNPGKIILILCMFIGRVGPAALFLSMIHLEKQNLITYPEEKIILG